MLFVRKSKYDELSENYNELKREYQKQCKETIRLSDKKSLLESRIEVLTNHERQMERRINNLSKSHQEVKSSKGGLTKQNNKLVKQINEVLALNKSLNEDLVKEKNLSKDKDNMINELTIVNKELNVKLNKLQGVTDNLNKLVSKKMRPKPTVVEITNYDKKTPVKK